MNKKNLEIINKFANSSPLAENISVEIRDYVTSYTSKNTTGAKYEDCVLLASLIQGATHFIYFLERNGYKITKRN